MAQHAFNAWNFAIQVLCTRKRIKFSLDKLSFPIRTFKLQESRSNQSGTTICIYLAVLSNRQRGLVFWTFWIGLIASWLLLSRGYIMVAPMNGMKPINLPLHRCLWPPIDILKSSVPFLTLSTAKYYDVRVHIHRVFLHRDEQLSC